MANSKISALTSATTPLAGTEVLPIVQSGSTKQVSVANLTAGRAISASSITATLITSNQFTQSIPTATATTILNIGGADQQGLIFVNDAGGTRIGACGRFANYYSGTDTPILDIVSNSGVSGSALTISGTDIQFAHTFGTNRTMRISVVYFNN